MMFEKFSLNQGILRRYYFTGDEGWLGLEGAKNYAKDRSYGFIRVFYSISMGIIITET